MAFRGNKAGHDIRCDGCVLTRETPCRLKLLVCTLVLTTLACSCLVEEGTVSPIVGVPVATAIPDEDIARAKEWIVSKISGRLGDLLEEPVVHMTAKRGLRVFNKTWGEETQHVDMFFGQYSLRLPLGGIAGYPWDSVEEQLDTGHAGPVVLRNGWAVWLGGIERKKAISHDLSIAVREACHQIALSGDRKRDQAVTKLCSDFMKTFSFEDDLELFRRLWRSPFEPTEGVLTDVREALPTFFLGDLKRLMAPPGAEEHIAEILTPWMKGFEFGRPGSRDELLAELFDERNHVSVLFVPLEPEGSPLEENLRQRILASVRRHGRWAPGLEMIRQAERVSGLGDLENGREVASLLLFSALQFPDHKTRAARMLVKLYPEDDPQRDGIIETVNFILQGD